MEEWWDKEEDLDEYIDGSNEEKTEMIGLRLSEEMSLRWNGGKQGNIVI